jgi:hypothetical protein
MRAVDRHTSGHIDDDIALLLLERSANGHPTLIPAPARPEQTSLTP